jgi:5-methylcytosine-specific restriction endonuclease McrA
MPSIAESMEAIEHARSTRAERTSTRLRATRRAMGLPVADDPAAEPSHAERSRIFYASGAWKRLRYEALKLHGARCQVCGRGAADGIKLHIDHVVPLSKDWSKRLDLNNLQVMCEDDNLGKSNRDQIDWRPKLAVNNAA